MDVRLEGEVRLPDYARLQVRFEGGLDLPPLELVQDGAETYWLKDGERVPVENPAGLSSPTPDYLGYLAAAQDVRRLDDPSSGETVGGDLVCYAYEINGLRFAEYVRSQLEAGLRADGSTPPPPGVTLSPSPLLQRLTGHGELWVGAGGLPRRQVIDLQIPKVTDGYDARAHLVVDFTFRDVAGDASAPSAAGVLSEPPGQWLPSESQLDLGLAPFSAFSLLCALTLASILVCWCRCRWVYAVIAVGVSVIMVVTPLLQVAGIARFQQVQAQTPPAATLAQALGLEDTVPQERPTAIRTSLSATTSPRCGDGDPSEDSDEDGLNDADEFCLGTDPEYEDSDRDMITDTLEVDGFDSGGHHWVSDPFKTDSNNDGLADFAEWPDPVGTAPHLDVADDWDPDGDGVPNLWDEDNDGDEVPDSLDLSPYARTAYSDTFSLSIQGGDFDGYAYVEV